MTTADNDDKNNSHEMLSKFNMYETERELCMHAWEWLFFGGLFENFSRTFGMSWDDIMMLESTCSHVFIASL